MQEQRRRRFGYNGGEDDAMRVITWDTHKCHPSTSQTMTTAMSTEVTSTSFHRHHDHPSNPTRKSTSEKDGPVPRLLAPAACAIRMVYMRLFLFVSAPNLFRRIWLRTRRGDGDRPLSRPRWEYKILKGRLNLLLVVSFGRQGYYYCWSCPISSLLR